MRVTDPFRVLGIPRGSNIATIRAAYRAKALELHPDQNPHIDTTDAMAMVNEAYAQLMDGEVLTSSDPALDWTETYAFTTSIGYERMRDAFRDRPKRVEDFEQWRRTWRAVVREQYLCRLPFDVDRAVEETERRWRIAEPV